MAAPGAAGTGPPVEPARLIHLALHMPKGFFHAVGRGRPAAVGPPDPGGPGAIEAWGLHALIAAVDRARISRAPFRLFDGLMAADWAPGSVKREFCRGLLACPSEAQRLEERTEALHTSIHAGPDPEGVFRYPRSGWS